MSRQTLRLLITPVLALAAAACGGGHEDAAPADRPPIAVQTGKVVAGELPGGVEAGGVVRARTAALLVARIMAPVREVRVAPGDRVRAGQALVVLDGRDLAAGERQARTAGLAAEQGARAASAERDAAAAALQLARASHARVAALHEKKSATAQELDEATAALRAAEARNASAGARVDQAEAGLASARAGGDLAAVTASYAVITAPFDGVVTEKLVEPGNMASPGSPLIRLEDTRGFRLEVRVDESRAQSVAVGADLPVTIDGAGPGGTTVVTNGRVAEVARAIDAGTRAFVVKIDVPDTTGLRSGMFGRARLPGPSRQGLAIPPAAVVRTGQVTAVYVVDQERARLRLVSLGEVTPAGVEVQAGLTAADVVVVAPPPDLRDGQRVSGGRTQGGAR
jgi:RND family efflux transporter MFP subunit